MVKGKVGEVIEDPRKSKHMDTCFTFILNNGFLKMDRIATYVESGSTGP